MVRTIAAVLMLALAGCATQIDVHKPPPVGWPNMNVTVQQVDGADLTKDCSSIRFEHGHHIACAVIHFDTHVCNIYTTDMADEVLAHEQEHCDGRDHVGESTIADQWERWKTYRESQGLRP